MHSSIEFHDSRISAIGREGTSIRITLDAYVHRWDVLGDTWKGTGWIQTVEIMLTHASGTPLEAPVDLHGGEFRIGEATLDNMMPLPFVSSEPTSLRFELVTGQVIHFNGRTVVVEATGVGRYMEDLSDDLRPSEAG